MTATSAPARRPRAEAGGGPPIRLLFPAMPNAAAVLPYLERIDATGIYSNYGPLDGELRERLGTMCGATGVALTTSGTTAIELALRAVTHRPPAHDPSGENPPTSATPGVVMPSYTFVATAHAVANAGFDPVLADIDPDTLMMTPETAERAMAELERPPAAVVPVSAFGAPLDMASWAAFRERHAIPVVFDAAAAATTLRGVGADPVCVSLHATKVPGIGEGGAVLTSDRALADRITAMTGFGFTGAARTAQVRGGNYRLSEYAAAVGLAALDGLPRHLDALRRVADRYERALRGRKSRLLDGFGSRWVSSTINVRVPVDRAEATTGALEAAGVPWRHWWGLGTHHHPAFACVARASLEATDRVAPTVIGLPFHPALTDAEIDRITDPLP